MSKSPTSKVTPLVVLSIVTKVPNGTGRWQKWEKDEKRGAREEEVSQGLGEERRGGYRGRQKSGRGGGLEKRLFWIIGIVMVWTKRS